MWWGMLLGCGVLVPSVEPIEVELSRFTVYGIDLAGEGGDAGASGVEIMAVLDVHNPWWAPFTIDELGWSFRVGDSALTSGELERGVFVRPNGITRVEVPIEITFADFAAATAELSAAEVPYALQLDVRAAAAGGPWHWPVLVEGAVPRMSVPTFDLVDWSADIEGSTLEVDVVVDVGMPEGFALHDGAWRLSVDEHRLGSGRFESRPEGPLHLPVVVDAGGTSAAGWSWMRGEARAMRFDLEGAVVTPAGVVPLEARRLFDIGGRAASRD